MLKILKNLASVGILGGTLLVAIAAASIPVQAASCKRPALKAVIAGYFEAADTHDMSALTAGVVRFAPMLR